MQNIWQNSLIYIILFNFKMDTNYEYLEEVEVDVFPVTNDELTEVNLTEFDEVGKHDNIVHEDGGERMAEPLRSRPMTRGYARQLYLEAHPEERETSGNNCDNNYDSDSDNNSDSDNDSNSDSNSDSDSDTEIIFGRQYKMTEYESAIVDFVIKPIVIFWICVLWNCIAFGNVKSNGKNMGDYEITRPSPYQMNVPNQMCGMERYGA